MFVLFSLAPAPTLILLHTRLACLYIIFLLAPLNSRALLRSTSTLIEAYLTIPSATVYCIMEASPSRSDSFSRASLGCKAVPLPSSLDADACLGCSVNSSTSFIDMDPEELFSMRWTSTARPAAEQEDEAEEFDFGQLTCAGARCSSPLLVGAGKPLLPCEPGLLSSPAFYSAQSTPASAVGSRRVGGAKASAQAPLLATRRILLRYLRLLAPLCRKVRALPVRVLAPRSTSRPAFAATTSSPARQSTSSYASAAEYWCQGHADTAVRDAILYCKKSVQGQDV